MPSTNHRSSSTRPSRTTSNRLQVNVIRSTSVPQRQFIFILTNNPELLRHTQDLQVQPTQQRQITTTTATTVPPQNINDAREEVLNDLLRVELREVARDYLSRSRRSYPLHYVFDMTDIEPRQP
ncbi:unnamed protein product [Rotaria magnacalcarata]|uniref:Uncharacterized protein n=1 Tax=Rotaria magnacalcarata TaxID=392030 RepID=A0A816XQH4_9BILA|nr:unnamed protein product [Rotaria magnacalcarata]CAF2130769.1 unnamed protein product [Rotaria magnacalcarata]CAF2149474.1 unnamed protein product [Rotaria magnacalcarata]CAF4113422.1 unnamed protein product [Rotaria magnacalcarata]CAF4866800.1 unnamed protein product [Rotaria magnacalcarata]